MVKGCLIKPRLTQPFTTFIWPAEYSIILLVQEFEHILHFQALRQLRRPHPRHPLLPRICHEIEVRGRRSSRSRFRCRRRSSRPTAATEGTERGPRGSSRGRRESTMMQGSCISCEHSRSIIVNLSFDNIAMLAEVMNLFKIR